MRRKYAKLSIGADVLQKQIICKIKIKRSPTRHDNIDFRPIITKISNIIPVSVVIAAEKGYDIEENHVLVRELLHGMSTIPTRSNMEDP